MAALHQPAAGRGDGVDLRAQLREGAARNVHDGGVQLAVVPDDGHDIPARCCRRMPGVPDGVRVPGCGPDGYRLRAPDRRVRVAVPGRVGGGTLRSAIVRRRCDRPVCGHHRTDERVPAVPAQQAPQRQTRAVVLRTHVRTERQPVRHGNRVHQPLFRSVPEVPGNQRPHVRA